MSKDVLWHDGREPNKVVEPPDRCFLGGVTYISADRVLEVIDSEAWSYCDYIIRHENGNGDKQSAASRLSENIREEVLALKGGEHK